MCVENSRIKIFKKTIPVNNINYKTTLKHSVYTQLFEQSLQHFYEFSPFLNNILDHACHVRGGHPARAVIILKNVQ